MPLSMFYSEFQQTHRSMTKRAQKPAESKGQALSHCAWGHTSGSHPPRKPPAPASRHGEVRRGREHRYGGKMSDPGEEAGTITLFRARCAQVRGAESECAMKAVLGPSYWGVGKVERRAWRIK